MNPLLTVAVVWGVGEAGDEAFLQGDEAARKKEISPFLLFIPSASPATNADTV